MTKSIFNCIQKNFLQYEENVKNKKKDQAGVFPKEKILLKPLLGFSQRRKFCQNLLWGFPTAINFVKTSSGDSPEVIILLEPPLGISQKGYFCSNIFFKTQLISIIYIFLIKQVFLFSLKIKFHYNIYDLLKNQELKLG